jgi:hypothetical protein
VASVRTEPDFNPLNDPSFGALSLMARYFFHIKAGAGYAAAEPQSRLDVEQAAEASPPPLLTL